MPRVARLILPSMLCLKYVGQPEGGQSDAWRFDLAANPNER